MKFKLRDDVVDVLPSSRVPPALRLLGKYWPEIVAVGLSVGGLVGGLYAAYTTVHDSEAPALVIAGVRGVIIAASTLVSGCLGIGLIQKVDDIRQTREDNRRTAIRVAAWDSEVAKKCGLDLTL